MYKEKIDQKERFGAGNGVIKQQRIYNGLGGLFGQLLVTACALCLIGVPAALSGQRLSMAPVNPDYLRYQERIAQGEVPTVSEEGYGLGFIPPLLDLSHTAGQVPSLLSTKQGLPDSYDRVQPAARA